LASKGEGQSRDAKGRVVGRAAAAAGGGGGGDEGRRTTTELDHPGSMEEDGRMEEAASLPHPPHCFGAEAAKKHPPRLGGWAKTNQQQPQQPPFFHTIGDGWAVGCWRVGGNGENKFIRGPTTTKQQQSKEKIGKCGGRKGEDDDHTDDSAAAAAFSSAADWAGLEGWLEVNDGAAG